MDRLIERDKWDAFFKEFSRNNLQRTTRLEVVDEAGGRSEEKGMPLLGIDIETRGTGTPRVEIMLGGDGAGSSHLSHTIPQVRDVRVKLGNDGREEVIAIESESNTKTLLYMQDLRELEP